MILVQAQVLTGHNTSPRLNANEKNQVFLIPSFRTQTFCFPLLLVPSRMPSTVQAWIQTDPHLTSSVFSVGSPWYGGPS
ncbi:hypothetical protein PSTG_17283 [Puccinia striiformis f. sp. tritici PST-78]|uniref:Uncharacterized protein n=1 Tax=Puccinia striiformis f. sp. tritici PST-78 TaxID=1165861 RepID=A0A0L0UQR8_9BASI|nr:hypothetical protein PSTG_17283 [Puccinia striiformis f. sp. tritici PST-78]